MNLGFKQVPRQISWRGIITLPLAIGIVVYGASLLGLYFLNQRGHNISCLFTTVTKQPCLLCGGTRASLAWASGNWPAAFLFNPMVTTFLTILTLLAILRLAFGLSPKIDGVPRWAWWTTAITIASANWWWVASHLP